MDSHEHWMDLAAELAERGRGWVEPNPVVGCVIVRDDQLIASGWHQRFGGAHAEIEALQVAGDRAAGATVYVTLEPCAHHGKTPPCVEALIQAAVARVVLATVDPFPQVAGRGVQLLQTAGIEVLTGVGQLAAQHQNAPFFKRVRQQLPWIIGKWGMSLDGKIATAAGESQWITGEESRLHAHQLRGKMDAIVVGIETALADDPLLTARPAGPRTPLRVVIDSQARLPLQSRLVASAREVPLLVAVGPLASVEKIELLEQAGCEVWRSSSSDPDQRLRELLQAFYRRDFTNVMVEGGGTLLAAFARIEQIDEIWAYIAPRLIGGTKAPHPLGGQGISRLCDSPSFQFRNALQLGTDVALQAIKSQLPCE